MQSSIPNPASASLFAELKQRVGPLWQQAQDHPFVHGIADGSLEQSKFIHYLEQDYAYCVAFCRAASLAAARAETVEQMQLFTGMVDAVLNHELAVHREYCAEFGLTPQQLEETEAAPNCRAYLDFCVATAALDDPLALLTALTPCAIGYAEIGARLGELTAGQAEHPYRRWIDMYSGEDYQGFARWIGEQLDNMGRELQPQRRDELERLFRLGCQYEWMFWEMACTEQRWPLGTAQPG